MVTAEGVRMIVKEVLRWPTNRKWEMNIVDTKCRAFFGAPSHVIADVWNELERHGLDDGAQVKHLLWGLVLIKVYATELVHCAIVGWPDPKTFRRWSWYILEKIADLERQVILLENRFKNFNRKTHCLMSVDGTYCPIMEPWPFSKKWFSHKLNGPGLKYEVGICIATGSIVWVKGPYCASVTDSTIFKEDLANRLQQHEGVEVDAGYNGHDMLKNKFVFVSINQRTQKSAVRARHEIVNSRLKQFNVLNHVFHHMKPNSDEMMAKHGICFMSCAVLTQLKMLSGEDMYEVEYSIGYD